MNIDMEVQVCDAIPPKAGLNSSNEDGYINIFGKFMKRNLEFVSCYLISVYGV